MNPIFAGIKNLFAGSGGKLIDSIKGAVDEFHFSGEEKAALTERLTQVANAHIEKMAELTLEEAKLELQRETAYLNDLANARAMQVEALKQDDKFSKRFVYYLAIGIITLTFAFDMCFFFISYPERNHDIVNMISGTLNSTGFAAVIYFFFGSSQSSKSSNETIRKMAEKSH